MLVGIMAAALPAAFCFNVSYHKMTTGHLAMLPPSLTMPYPWYNKDTAPLPLSTGCHLDVQTPYAWPPQRAQAVLQQTVMLHGTLPLLLDSSSAPTHFDAVGGFGDALVQDFALSLQQLALLLTLLQLLLCQRQLMLQLTVRLLHKI